MKMEKDDPTVAAMLPGTRGSSEIKSCTKYSLDKIVVKVHA